MATIHKITVQELQEHKDSAYVIQFYKDEGVLPGMPVPNPNFDIYKTLEANGVLDIYGAFEGSDMVGFSCTLTAVNPHYGYKITTIESLYVLKDKRKGTDAGIGLLRACKTLAKLKGSVGMFAAAQTGTTLAKAYRAMKCTHVHDIFFWELNDE